jgi:hypothetical protein
MAIGVDHALMAYRNDFLDIENRLHMLALLALWTCSRLSPILLSATSSMPNAQAGMRAAAITLATTSAVPATTASPGSDTSFSE